ncbi:MAG: DUF4387 domain-containing protein [Defluviitaleaceae bacterium]|nr:DUF4387 domain-containing protein [Defluviitaleaceae bacterium]
MRQMKLIEIADVIRSKNSGPYEITFDVIFKTRELYERVCEKNAINKENFAKLYNIPVKNVMEVVHFDPVGAVKVTIIRPIPSGAFGESDVYGAQQHAPLMGMDIDI